MKKLLLFFFLALTMPLFSQIYSRVDSYHDGLAMVSGYTSENGYSKKYGYVNEYNKLVIPLKYEYAESFERGTAVVGIGIKYGVINQYGKLVLPVKYDEIKRFQFSDGTQVFFVYDKNGVGCANLSGNLIIPCQYECYACLGASNINVNNGPDKWNSLFVAMLGSTDPYQKWYLFDPHDGKPILPQGGYLRSGVYPYVGGISAVSHYYKGAFPCVSSDIVVVYPVAAFEANQKTGLYDFINHKVVVNPSNASIERCAGDLYKVGDGKCFGVLDKTGKMIVPVEYDQISVGYDLQDLSIKVHKGEVFGVLDAEGNVKVPVGCKKEKVINDYELMSYNGKYGLTKKGKWLLYVDFDTIVLDRYGEVMCEGEGKYGMVNLQSLKKDGPIGKEILVFDDMSYLEGYGFLRKKDGKWGLDYQEPPFMFDSIANVEGHLVVKQYGKWGFYNKGDSKEIVYYDTKPVSMAVGIVGIKDGRSIIDGSFFVIKDGKAGIISKDDYIIVPFDYDDIMFLSRYNQYKAYFALKQNGKWALCEVQYDYCWKPDIKISSFAFDEIKRGGRDVFPMRIGEKWGFVYWGNDHGKRKVLTIKAKYDEVDSFQETKALVRKGNKQFYIDRQGKKVK